jgi:hypothetical protein
MKEREKNLKRRRSNKYEHDIVDYKNYLLDNIIALLNCSVVTYSQDENIDYNAFAFTI